MRRRSIAGPLILLVIGGLFLWNNLHPELPVFDLLSQYWPFLLIGWGVVRLVEVLVWHQAVDGRTFTGGEIALVVLLCLAGMGMFEAHRNNIHVNPFGFGFHGRGVEMFGQQYDYPVTARVSAEGVKRIVFENPRGNIRVTGNDVQEVAVTGRKMVRAYNRSDSDRADHDTPVELVRQGDRILVRTNQDHVSSQLRISADLEVTVPRSVTVEARNTAGDFDISDIGGDVELASGRADVRLGRIGGNARVDLGRSDVVRALDVKGNVDLQGRGSDIELENVGGQVTVSGSYGGTVDFKNLAKPLHFESRNTDLRVEAVPGKISMDLGEFNGKNLVGPVKLTTKSRDIKIEAFTQSLDLETERGDIELEPSHAPLAKVEARTKMGRIDLVLPEKAAFQLDATAERGEAVNDFGPAIRQESDGRRATLRGKAGNGAMIHLTTERGSVAVRRAGAASSAEAPAAPAAPVAPRAPKALKPAEKGLAATELKL
jgi:hypothetical protein